MHSTLFQHYVVLLHKDHPWQDLTEFVFRLTATPFILLTTLRTGLRV